MFSKNVNKEFNKEEKIVQELKTKLNVLSGNSITQCLDTIIPVASEINQEYEQIANENDEEDYFLEEILTTQISSIKAINEIEEETEVEVAQTDVIEEQQVQEQKQEQLQVIQEINGPLKTEVITNNPLKESFSAQYNKVKIKNQTSYTLTQEMLTPDVTIENKNVIIFHTHSCESYTSSESYSYTPTGTFRTTDLNFTVTRVGTELENHLKNYNYNVVHNTDYHDYPAYNGSYTRSLSTVEGILKNKQSDIILDLHRDAIGSRSDYAPIVKIGEKDVAAQLMFVIGTNQGGLWHPNWNQNLKFAIKIQEKAEELYPGLFKPILLTDSRYNQHTGKYASIIEVGATGNTLEQCLTSMKYLANVMNEVMK